MAESLSDFAIEHNEEGAKSSLRAKPRKKFIIKETFFVNSQIRLKGDDDNIQRVESLTLFQFKAVSMTHRISREIINFIYR